MPLPQTLCGVGGLAGSIVSAFFGAVGGWFADSVRWLLGRVGAALQSTTAPPVTTHWFLAKQRQILVVAVPIGILALLGAACHAVVTGGAAELVRTVVVRLPVAFLLGGATAGVVGVALAATDDVCAMLSSSNGESLDTIFAGLSRAVGLTGGLAGSVGVIVLGVVLGAALLLWVELVVRSAAITVLTAVLPLVLAASLWPPATVWVRRLVEALGALVVSKAAIVLVMSIALEGLVAPTDGAGTLLTVGAMLLLAALTPYVLLRLIPAFEGAVIGNLEQVRARTSAAVERRGRQAVSMAAIGFGPAGEPALDLVGSDPVPWAQGTFDDIIKGTALDPDARFPTTAPPLLPEPASQGTHVWGHDKYGPQLVWVPRGGRAD